MSRCAVAVVTLVAVMLLQGPVLAGPEEDRLAFQSFYQEQFPDVPYVEFANGIYAIDEDARSQWLSIEDFPPYEFSVDRGREVWPQTLPNGRTLADCFDADSGELRAQYPQFDVQRGEVVTLEMAVNLCREANGLPPLSYGSTEIIDIVAYLAFEARGKPVDVRIPQDQPGALAAYEAGKRFYYSKRGQLNFACADCHVKSVGQYVRADHLGPSFGHPTHFPVYRSKLGGMISLHQRFFGCVRDVRAKPFELQSVEFRNLEYFLTYMSNGLEFNGPGARK